MGWLSLPTSHHREIYQLLYRGYIDYIPTTAEEANNDIL
jgi:hypothetical protein